jgi:DNA-binding SARP family transcriptional activator
MMLTVRLFGPTSCEVDGRVVTPAEMGGVKPRQILEILALSLGAPVAKDHLADLLWPAEPPTSYIGTLESYVCVLRRSLGIPGGRRSPLATTSSGYMLDPEQVLVDVAEFRRLANLVMSQAAVKALPHADQALSLLTGELLASEPYTDWAVRERESLVRTKVEFCVRGALLATATGDHDAAVRLARHAVAEDPLSEDAGQQLMRALWFAGRRGEALRAYSALRQVLLDELGDVPGHDSHELYLAILRDSNAGGLDRDGRPDAEVEILMALLRQAMESNPTAPVINLTTTRGDIAAPPAALESDELRSSAISA